MPSSSSSEPERAPEVQRMVEGMREAGLKLTPQRLAIARELAGDTTHPTAQDIFQRLVGEMPTMSFATVYNSLSALADAGLCVSRTFDRGSARFDPVVAPHDHAVCDRCGAIRDVTPTGASARGQMRSARAELDRAAFDFELRAVERVYRGRCAACLDDDSSPSQTH